MKMQNCPCGVPSAMNEPKYGKMNRRVILVKIKFLRGRGGGGVQFIDQIKYVNCVMNKILTTNSSWDL